jgi:hypothetical protein
MATPNIIKNGVGFDTIGYPSGTLATNWPWRIITSASAPSIVTGAGAFSGNALAFNAGSTPAQAAAYFFPSTGQFMRNSTANTGVYMYGMNFWLNCTVAPTSTTALPLVQWSTQASLTSVIPCLGIMNPTSGGLQIAFPSTVASIATSPYTLPISTGTYYWVSCAFVGYPNGQLFATYTVNGITLQSNVAITYGSDPISTNICNAAVFYGGGTTMGQYEIDDLVIQASSGADSDWIPGGGGTSTPTSPTMAQFPIMSPRRIYNLPLTSNGSVTQFTTMDGGTTPNWQAASEGGSAYTQATATGQTDLYKTSAASGISNLTNVIGLVVSSNTNRYLSVEPTERDSSTGTIVQNPGIVSKGVSSFISVQEQNQSGAVWSATTIGNAEFGATSI